MRTDDGRARHASSYPRIFVLRAVRPGTATTPEPELAETTTEVTSRWLRSQRTTLRAQPSQRVPGTGASVNGQASRLIEKPRQRRCLATPASAARQWVEWLSPTSPTTPRALARVTPNEHTFGRRVSSGSHGSLGSSGASSGCGLATRLSRTFSHRASASRARAPKQSGAAACAVDAP